jgi:hypothetical protein
MISGSCGGGGGGSSSSSSSSVWPWRRLANARIELGQVLVPVGQPRQQVQAVRDEPG